MCVSKIICWEEKNISCVVAMRDGFIIKTFFINLYTSPSVIMRLLTNFQLIIKLHMGSSALKPQRQMWDILQGLNSQGISSKDDFWLDIASTS